jgi:hypothetical protein
MEAMNSKMVSSEGNSKSRMSCKLGDSTSHAGGVVGSLHMRMEGLNNIN